MDKLTIKSLTTFSMIKFLADTISDGHFTLMKFTTNYRAGFYTPNNRDDIDKMAEGKTVEEALNNALIKFMAENKNNPNLIDIINQFEIGINLEIL